MTSFAGSASAQNTVFCGRIQLFLAQLFPLSEKSALNLMSHFNLDKVTAFNEDEHAEGTRNDDTTNTPMEVESTNFSFDSTDTNAPIDFNLYCKLWSLQDFFRQPTQCYTTEQWKTLTSNMEEIFQAFGSYKLEEEARSSGSRTKQRTSSVSGNVDYKESHYFANVPHTAKSS